MNDSAQNALAAKRVGQYLIDAGVLTSGQLDEALDRQKRMGKAGFHVLLGTILEEMGAIDRQSLEAIILRQRLDEGSVNLGPEVDWSPFRSKAEAPAPAEGNGFTYPAPAAGNGFGQHYPAAPLSPEHAVAAMNTFFGEPETAEPEAEATAPAAEAEEAKNTNHETQAAPPWELASQPAGELESQTPAGSPWEFDSHNAAASFTPLETAVAGAPETPSAEDPVEAPAWTLPDSHVEAPAWHAEPVTDESIPSFPLNSANAVASPAAEPVAVPTETPEKTAPAWKAPDEAPMPAVPVWEAPAYKAEASEPVEQAEPTPYSAYEPMSSRQAPVDILGFRFSREVSGLAETEVSAVVSQLVRRTRTLEEQNAEAKDNLSHLDSMRRYGEQSVKAADAIAEQIREEAEQQARAIRDRAQQEARKIVADARSKHDEIVHEAGVKALHVAGEIKKSIDEHRAINETLAARAEALIETDSNRHED